MSVASAAAHGVARQAACVWRQAATASLSRCAADSRKFESIMAAQKDDVAALLTAHKHSRVLCILVCAPALCSACVLAWVAPVHCLHLCIARVVVNPYRSCTRCLDCICISYLPVVPVDSSGQHLTARGCLPCMRYATLVFQRLSACWYLLHASTLPACNMRSWLQLLP